MHRTLHESGSQHVVLTEPADQIPCWWTETDQTQDTTCLWCGVSLDPSEPCLRFQSTNPEGAQERAYCCIADAKALLTAIVEHAPPDNCHIKTEGDENSAALMYEQSRWSLDRPQPCLWCDNDIEPSDPCYSVYTSGVSTHEHCGTPMAEAVERQLEVVLNQHADELLGDLL